MNLESYAFDSESDDDEEETRTPVTKGSHTHIQDINKVLTWGCRKCLNMLLQLKEQTTELLDPVWKEARNRQLLMKMLELEEPTITAKVDEPLCGFWSAHVNPLCRWWIFCYKTGCVKCYWGSSLKLVPRCRGRVKKITSLTH
jgi:hypothetical protein